MHAQFEFLLNGGSLTSRTVEVILLAQFLRSQQGTTAYRTEWRVYADDEDIAGSIDYVAERADSSKVIVDWKRTRRARLRDEAFGVLADGPLRFVSSSIEALCDDCECTAMNFFVAAGPESCAESCELETNFFTFEKGLVSARAAAPHRPPSALGQCMGPKSTNGRASFKATRSSAVCASAAVIGLGTIHSPTAPTLAPGKGLLVSNMPMVGSQTEKGGISIVHAAAQVRPVTTV